MQYILRCSSRRGRWMSLLHRRAALRRAEGGGGGAASAPPSLSARRHREWIQCNPVSPPASLAL